MALQLRQVIKRVGRLTPLLAGAKEEACETQFCRLNRKATASLSGLGRIDTAVPVRRGLPGLRECAMTCLNSKGRSAIVPTPATNELVECNQLSVQAFIRR